MLKIAIVISLLAVIAHAAVVPQEANPQLDGRIVGGREVSITKHRHQISLRHRTCSTCAYTHSCGGSIYNAETIITAAHCVNGRYAGNFTVVAGSDNRNSADGVIARVRKVVQHEKYNSTITDNDVALIFLSTPLPLNGLTIGTIKLAQAAPTHGAKATVTGWGTTSSGGQAANKLQEVEVIVVNNQDCEDMYGEGRITPSMMCAGVDIGGKDSCQGDSGGPLLVDHALAGIVSWGRGCGTPGYPGVYASAAYLGGWIEKTIQENL